MIQIRQRQHWPRDWHRRLVAMGQQTAGGDEHRALFGAPQRRRRLTQRPTISKGEGDAGSSRP
jgi:hypothetical protein